MRKEDLVVGAHYTVNVNKTSTDNRRISKHTELIFQDIRYNKVCFVTLEGDVAIFWDVAYIEPIKDRVNRRANYERAVVNIEENIVSLKSEIKKLEKEKQDCLSKIENIDRFASDEDEMEFRMREIIKNNNLSYLEKKKHMLELLNTFK